MASRKPLLQALMKIDRSSREALLLGIYFVANHFDEKGYVKVSQKKLQKELRLKQPNISRGSAQLKKAKFLDVKKNADDKRERSYKLKAISSSSK